MSSSICQQNPANLAALGDRPSLPLQALVLRLDVYEEAVLRTTYGRDGSPVACDEVSPFDLAAAFAGLNVGTGLLPRDTLWCRRAGREYTVGIYLPPATRALRLAGVAEAIAIPLPPLVFAGGGNTYSIYALAGSDWPDARAPLYRAPFPNVYPDGRICPGSVQFPACAPETVRRAAEAFFESEFNHDLSNGASRRHPRDVALVWAELAVEATLQPDWAEYPVDDLVEMNRTLGDLMEDGHALR